MAEYTVKELVFNHEKAFIPEKAAGLEAIVQYHLTGDEGGSARKGRWHEGFYGGQIAACR